jgi:hypothetical protein
LDSKKKTGAPCNLDFAHRRYPRFIHSSVHRKFFFPLAHFNARRWYVHVDSAFPLVPHYRGVLGWGLKVHGSEVSWSCGLEMPRIQGKSFFQEDSCYHGIDERIGLQEQKLWGIFSGQEVAKTFIRLSWPRLLHNLGRGQGRVSTGSHSLVKPSPPPQTKHGPIPGGLTF